MPPRDTIGLYSLDFATRGWARVSAIRIGRDPGPRPVTNGTPVGDAFALRLEIGAGSDAAGCRSILGRAGIARPSYPYLYLPIDRIPASLR